MNAFISSIAGGLVLAAILLALRIFLKPQIDEFIELQSEQTAEDLGEALEYSEVHLLWARSIADQFQRYALAFGVVGSVFFAVALIGITIDPVMGWGLMGMGMIALVGCALLLRLTRPFRTADSRAVRVISRRKVRLAETERAQDGG